MSGIFKRGLILLCIGAIAALFVWHSHAWVQRQLARHTPVLDLKAPAELAGLPVFDVLPKRRWLLWLPGVPTLSEHRIEQKFAAVHRARMESHFFENRLALQLEPRVPLVQCHGQFMDGEGVLFDRHPANSLSGAHQSLMAMDPGLQAEKPFPQMVSTRVLPDKNLGSWLLALSHIPWWSDVAELKENSLGVWTLTLRSGTVFIWGASDENVPAEAAALQKTLARAAADHGGALRADLRFFREGRIIVEVRRPLHA